MVLPIILSSVPIAAGYTGFKYVQAAIRKTGVQSREDFHREEQASEMKNEAIDEAQLILQLIEY